MSQSTPPFVATVAGGLPAEEIRAELQAVLQSAAFERSDKLQKFLRFICELTLQGEGWRINEYLIGSEVFLRGPSYSPSEDSIVRRQAHSLRQKLQEYYAGEGKTNAIHIELPVGRYVPGFRRVEAEAAAPAAAQELEQSRSGVAGAASHSRRSASLAVLAVIASLSLGYLLGRRPWNMSPAETAAGPATAEIWAHWRQAPRPTVICFSSPMTAVIKHFDQTLPATAIPARFRAHAAEEELFSEAFRVPPGGAYYFTPAVNQTKIGEALPKVTRPSITGSDGISEEHTVPSRLGHSSNLLLCKASLDDFDLIGAAEAAPVQGPAFENGLGVLHSKAQRLCVKVQQHIGNPVDVNVGDRRLEPARWIPGDRSAGK